MRHRAFGGTGVWWCHVRIVLHSWWVSVNVSAAVYKVQCITVIGSPKAFEPHFKSQSIQTSSQVPKRSNRQRLSLSSRTLGTFTMLIVTSILALCLALQVRCADPSYVVYPSDGTKTDQTNAILAQLKGLADPKPIHTSSTKHFGVNFWRLPLTHDHVKKVQSIKNVGLCFSFVVIVEWIYLNLWTGCLRELAVWKRLL